MNIHVGNLSPDTTEEELHKLFSQFGQVKSVKIITEPNRQSKGYGFIDMPGLSEAQKALLGLKNKPLNGKRIMVSEARPKRY